MLAIPRWQFRGKRVLARLGGLYKTQNAVTGKNNGKKKFIELTEITKIIIIYKCTLYCNLSKNYGQLIRGIFFVDTKDERGGMNDINSLYEILKTRATCEDENKYILFHGTSIYFSNIDLAKPKLTSDFGKGFYLTNILEQAVLWAGNRRREKIIASRDLSGKIIIPDFNSAYVLKYELSFDKLEKLNLKLKVFDKYNREWLDIILLGRRHLGIDDVKIENTEDILTEYDIIAGPMADNKLQFKLDDYEAAPYDREELLKEIQMERESYQIVFRTEKSLNALNRLNESFDMKF